MGDKKKPAEKKKRLKLAKETVSELSDEQLDQVAGGATNTCLGEGVQRGKGAATCSDTMLNTGATTID